MNVNDIKFTEDGHIYTAGDHRIMSVTTLLHLDNPTKYAHVSEATLERASEKGTEVHNAIECYVKYGIERDDLQEFRNFKFLQKMFKFEVLGSEVMVLLEHNGIELVGTTDLVLNYKGELALGDIKRTSVLDKEYLAKQLNLYRLAYQQTYGQEIKHLIGIHLREDKRKLIELPINEAYALDLIENHIDEIKDFERKEGKMKPRENSCFIQPKIYSDVQTIAYNYNQTFNDTLNVLTDEGCRSLKAHEQMNIKIANYLDKSEKKEKRIQVLMCPSLHDRLKAFANEKAISVNEAINLIIEYYFTKQ